MKILHLLPYIPTPANFGGALRIYHILNHLTKNHDVTVAGFGNSGDLEKFHEAFPELEEKTHFVTHPWKKKFRRLIQLYSLFTNHSFWYTAVTTKKMQQTIDGILAKQDFDIIQSEFPSMGFFDLKSDATKILDAHNVEYDNFRRMANLKGSKLRQYFYQREYEKLYEEEIKVCRTRDAVFTTSDRDSKLFNEDAPEVPKYVIPNGVDLSYFHPGNEEPEPHSLVFVGMMGYVPNHDGMKFFLDDIFPRVQDKFPDIKIYIVGKDAPPELKDRATENIIVTDFVEDVRPYVWRSSVYVVPLRMGGGTRLKVLEALSMKKPLVTTSIGCEGIEVEHEETALIADDPAMFSEEVIRLIENKSLQDKISSNGYELVKSTYDWKVIGKHIEHAYADLLETNEVTLV